MNKISSSLADSQRMLVDLMQSTQKSLMESKDVTMNELTTQQLLGIINYQDTHPDPINEENESEGHDDFPQDEDSDVELDELGQASRTVKEVHQMIEADTNSYQEVFENIQLQLKTYLKKI